MERCAVLQATRSVLTQSLHPSRVSLARSNHFSQKGTGGPSCTLYTTLTPMRMEAEFITFLWQQPRPKIPAVSRIPDFPAVFSKRECRQRCLYAFT